MAAPVPAARVTPSGTKLDDGFRTLVAFTADTDVGFWEKSVTPPGYEGGDPVDTTTMHNEVYRTKNSRFLIEMTPFEMTSAYDPEVYTTARALINVNTTVTVHFPDNHRLAFFGFLQNFQPGELVEGEQPEASLTVVPTNQDPTTGAEEDPVIDNLGT